MRTLRLALAGTVILMLLGGLGGVVVAQDEEVLASDGPHPVSGTTTYRNIFGVSDLTVEDGRYMRRGYGSYATIEMDDARLSGTLWYVWNQDAIAGPVYQGDGEVETGTATAPDSTGNRCSCSRIWR